MDVVSIKFIINTIDGYHNPSGAGYLVFEIMDDRKPHPKPWFGSPSVGMIENFDQASCLGIRLEWFDPSKDAFFTVPIHRKNLRMGFPTEGFKACLSIYRQAMTIIQLLEGITWIGSVDILGIHNKNSLGAKVLELKVDHLAQICQWIPRPKKSVSAPRIASWQRNFQLMKDQFGINGTIVGPTTPPDPTSAFWYPTMNDAMGIPKTRSCDLCFYSTTVGTKFKCERDETRPDVWVCKFCSFLNRPCTFTPPSMSRQYWGDTPPHIQHRNNGVAWSVYPTGPHRFLAFHHAIPLNELSTPVRVPEPLEGRDALELEE